MPGGLAHVCSVFPQNNEDEHMEFRPLESTTSTYAKCPLRFWYKNHAFLAQVLIYITRFISQYKNLESQAHGLLAFSWNIPRTNWWSAGFFFERIGNTSIHVLRNSTAASTRSKTTCCSEKNYLESLTMTVSSVAVVYSASLLEARYKFPSPSPLLAL